MKKNVAHTVRRAGPTKQITLKNSVWYPASFEVHDEDIVMISKEILIVPEKALDILGDVQYIHTGACYGRRQEILVNGERIYSVIGGWNYSIRYFETLAERIESQEEYGRILSFRRAVAQTPWRICKLTKFIADDEQAIEILKKIRYAAENTDITIQQRNVLQRKFGRRNQFRTIKAILALDDDSWDIIGRRLKKSDNYQNYLAQYIINKGKLPYQNQ